MSTTMATKATVERKWYVLDAAGKPLGKTAALAADLLRGKLKPTYTPHVDCGDFVIIINAEQAVLTGKKLEEKYYRRHSGWIGGLKESKYKDLMAKRPEFAMTQAVKGMLQEQHGRRPAHPPEGLPRRRAQARRPEARSLGPLTKEEEQLWQRM